MMLRCYDDIGEQVYSDTLENGLRIIVVPKRGYAKSLAFLATRYGGADRKYSLNGKHYDTPMGVAHFLEHKMFDMPYGSAMNAFSENGASPNAFTSSDMTAYHFSATEKFYDDLKILLDFVFTPYFSPESVQKEQGIIAQEIKMGEDDPMRIMYYGLLKALFKTNPIRYSVAGTVESIAEITDETLYDCHKSFYNPSNMVLCCIGDIEPDEVYRIAEDSVRMESAPIPVVDYGEEEALTPFEQRFEAGCAVSRPIFMIGAKAAFPRHRRDIQKLEVIGNMAVRLISGKSSRLFNELYEKGLVNEDFSGSFETGFSAAYSVFEGESDDPDAVYGRIKDEIAALAEKGPDEASLERVKRAMIGSELRAFNSFSNVAYAQAYAHFMGYDPCTSVPVIRSVSADDIRRFVKSELSPERMAISIVRPS